MFQALSEKNMAMGGLKRVETINSKGCSRLFVGFSSSIPSFRTFQSFDLMSPSPTTSHGSELSTMVRSLGPLSGLVICVTGLSKGQRFTREVECSKRCCIAEGDPYSTLGILQKRPISGSKFEHVLKHRSRNGLFVVTIGWFVDSVKSNIRLSESVYTVKGIGECSPRVDELNLHVGSTDSSCLPSGFHETKKIKTIKKLQLRSSDRISDKCMDSTLSGHTLYIDSNISGELWNKVLEVVSKEGAATIDRWFVGCGVSLVVCEESSVHQYIGHSSNVVTPLWVLKTAKDRNLLRLVRVSVDLARQIGTVLETSRNHNAAKFMQNTESLKRNATHEERQQITCQTPVHPISPSTLLDSIYWSISKPTSSARIYTESFSGDEDSDHRSIFFDANGDGKNSGGSFMDLTRLLTESSEKNELILENQFLTILFLVDQFSEMGPSSRTYFSHNGFTCLQVLDYIYEFYQENMSSHEIESAIHTDSRHADRLRVAYSSKETVECGYVIFKRIDFLGSRKSFEMLKRVSWDNNSIVYELLLRA
ncbi:hypothetical protein Gogos_011123 [Gossypium gossypioides]|uniref:DUF6699 domain-containing protein n=1 Tax=Gossypium gossypioides TaxID=34282 RepID=A0A7J9BNC2_GOSGO|nr:hypothetical protein [Gossypium gossypioides]